MDPSVDMEAGGQGHWMSAVYFKVSRGIVGRDKFAYFQWFWSHLIGVNVMNVWMFDFTLNQ